MNKVDPTTVRLDESTDAGEFLTQNLWHLPNDLARAAFVVVCKDEPLPAELAVVLGTDLTRYDLVLNGLGQYGMEFESMAERGDFDEDDATTAERGVSSAERFVRAAREIAANAKEGVK